MSSKTHTLYQCELRKTPGTTDEIRLRLLVSGRRWSLRKGPGGMLCWFTRPDNQLPFCDANYAGSPGRVYPIGWHPAKPEAVLAYYEEQNHQVQSFGMLRAEALARRQLASDWLEATKAGGTV